MTMMLGPLREGAVSVPLRKKPSGGIPSEAPSEPVQVEQPVLRRPVLPAEHEERPEEVAKESRREVPTPHLAPIAEGEVASAQPSGRAAKLAALREQRAKERAAREPAKAPPEPKPAAVAKAKAEPKAKKAAAKPAADAKPAAKPKAKAKAKAKAKPKAKASK
jgi:hypothetical protein